jgi:hypothetical protein
LIKNLKIIRVQQKARVKLEIKLKKVKFICIYKFQVQPIKERKINQGEFLAQELKICNFSRILIFIEIEAK